MSIYDDYINQRTAWVKPRMSTAWPGWGGGVEADNSAIDAQMNAYRAEEKALGDQWLAQLAPAQQADVLAHFQGKADTTAKINKYGKLAALATIAAAAGGAAGGLLGAGAETAGAGATGMDFGAAAEAGTLAGGEAAGAGSVFANPSYVSIPGAVDTAGASFWANPAFTAMPTAGPEAAGIAQGLLDAGYVSGTAGGQALFDAAVKGSAPSLWDQLISKAPEAAPAAKSLLGDLLGGAGGGGAGGSLGLPAQGGPRGTSGYVPPGLLPNVGFKAPTGLAALARSMGQPQQRRWNLLGE